MLDAFELAVGAASADVDDKVRKGVELVYAELLGVLEKAGSNASTRRASRSTRTSTKR